MSSRRKSSPVFEAHSSPVVAIGTFDGVHIGHRHVIERAVRAARASGRRALVMTFDPHPQHVVNPRKPMPLLTLLPERLEELHKLDIDEVVVLPFTIEMSQLSAKEFVEKILVGTFQVKELFIGYDFKFGHKREGHAAILKKLGKKYGFGIHIIAPVKLKGHVVKSSAVREMLLAGDVEKASRFLGHHYWISGWVGQGDHRGKTLGFPTANLEIPLQKLIPADGVYAGIARYGEKSAPCVVNIGRRPTFGGGRRLVEVHLIGKKLNLRGRRLDVAFAARLRDEKKFKSVDELVAQIKKDIESAKRVLRNDH